MDSTETLAILGTQDTLILFLHERYFNMCIQIHQTYLAVAKTVDY